MGDSLRKKLNGHRFIKAVTSCGRKVLYKIFLLGTPDKPSDMKLRQYLINSQRENVLKFFNSTQKKMIDENADGSKFDVSLLFASIKVACKDVAAYHDPVWSTASTHMEYYITAVKNMRNDCLHGQLIITVKDYLENMTKLRELLTGCLETSGERYVRDQSEVQQEIQQMNVDLDNIMKEILGKEDLLKFCGIEIKSLMINDSRVKLKEIFQSISYVNPVSFITSNLKLEVDKIFVDIEVKHGQRGGQGQHISYKHLLKLIQTTQVTTSTRSASQQQGTSTPPHIILVEGVAGSGKTTLVTLVIDEWTKGGQGNISDLDNYELLLWVQCRDPTMTCYQQLLDRLMPEVAIKFKDILPKLMKLCRILIIIDGLDEDNDSSRRLVQSLLQEFKYCSNIAFLCTSRPEKVENFRRTIPAEYTVQHATLHGISRTNVEQFVRLNHQEITKQTGKNRNTEELVTKIRKLQGLQEHLRLPMNLILMIYIWDQDPDQLNLTSVTHTELYYNIHQLCKHKLIHRLTNHQDTKNMDDRKLKVNINNVLITIYKTALESLSRDQINLGEETVDKLISTCDKLCLPYKEVLSAFLCLRPTWTMLGIKEQYSAPHKGIQDYFAALYIVNMLNNPQYSTPTPASATHATPVTVRGVLEDSTRSGVVDMNKYQNVLIHVAGLLHLVLDQVPETAAQEVVHLLQESGVRDNNEWLDLLDNTNMSPVIVRKISGVFDTGETIDVRNECVRSYAALLPHLSCCEVRFDIHGDQPHLLHLLAALTHHHCTHLQLWHHYEHADTTNTSDNILQLLPHRLLPQSSAAHSLRTPSRTVFCCTFSAAQSSPASLLRTVFCCTAFLHIFAHSLLLHIFCCQSSATPVFCYLFCRTSSAAHLCCKAFFAQCFGAQSSARTVICRTPSVPPSAASHLCKAFCSRLLFAHLLLHSFCYTSSAHSLLLTVFCYTVFCYTVSAHSFVLHSLCYTVFAAQSSGKSSATQSFTQSLPHSLLCTFSAQTFCARLLLPAFAHSLLPASFLPHSFAAQFSASQLLLHTLCAGLLLHIFVHSFLLPALLLHSLLYTVLHSFCCTVSAHSFLPVFVHVFCCTVFAAQSSSAQFSATSLLHSFRCTVFCYTVFCASL
nr:uncharacterized protein LOC128694949 [Cherax quadricarinatus]